MVKNKSVFIDSNYFCGIHNLDDTLHNKSKKFRHKLKDKNFKLFVSNYIVSEILTVLSQRVGKTIANEFGANIYQKKGSIKILRTNREIELKSFKIFKKIKSKNFSFVDATNLALIKKHKINFLLTFDSQLIKIAKNFGIKSLS